MLGTWLLLQLPPFPPPPQIPVYVDQSMRYTDFVSIVLTALAVILAALAIAIGVAAIWGYRTIVEEAGKIAQTSAEKAVENQIMRYFQGQAFQETLAKVTGGTATPSATAETGKVAEPYPDGGTK